jgi:hypothetical protein
MTGRYPISSTIRSEVRPCAMHLRTVLRSIPSSRAIANAAELVATAVEETLAYYDFPEEYWRRIRTTDVFDKRVFWVRS